MRRLRIAAISYLNTAPLMWDFDHGEVGRHFEISYTLPSDCADALRDGTADIGIIPAFAYSAIPGLAILPDVAIAAKGPVRSILLVSKKPIDEVRTVALDRSSMSSVALTKVLFAKWWGSGRQFRQMQPNLELMLRECDAALIIGDPALNIDRSRYLTFDLAEEWQKFTGKPFVFAFWTVRESALAEASPDLDLARIFRDSRDHGLEPASVDQIAREWSSRLGRKESDLRSYLARNICYVLDAECREGMQLFFRYAAECGIISKAPKLRFLASKSPALMNNVRSS